jgi:AcrR family transcriptional regulator
MTTAAAGKERPCRPGPVARRAPAAGLAGAGTGIRPCVHLTARAEPAVRLPVSRKGGRLTAKTKRMPRSVREQQMLDAAVATFARQGYRAASMDEIAEQAGVSKPLVYLYLNSKEELFTACVEREANALAAAVRRGAKPGTEPGTDPEWRLEGGLRGFFAHTASHPDGWAVLYQQARTQGQPFAERVAAMRAEIVGVVTELISAAARDTDGGREAADRDVAGLAHALVGAAESLADWANRTPGRTPHETTAILMDFAWPGLRFLPDAAASRAAP